jgi:hypothetical protein
MDNSPALTGFNVTFSLQLGEEVFLCLEIELNSKSRSFST